VSLLIDKDDDKYDKQLRGLSIGKLYLANNA